MGVLLTEPTPPCIKREMGKGGRGCAQLSFPPAPPPLLDPAGQGRLPLTSVRSLCKLALMGRRCKMWSWFVPTPFVETVPWFQSPGLLGPKGTDSPTPCSLSLCSCRGRGVFKGVLGVGSTQLDPFLVSAAQAGRFLHSLAWEPFLHCRGRQWKNVVKARCGSGFGKAGRIRGTEHHWREMAEDKWQAGPGETVGASPP